VFLCCICLLLNKYRMRSLLHDVYRKSHYLHSVCCHDNSSHGYWPKAVSHAGDASFTEWRFTVVWSEFLCTVYAVPAVVGGVRKVSGIRATPGVRSGASSLEKFCDDASTAGSRLRLHQTIEDRLRPPPPPTSRRGSSCRQRQTSRHNSALRTYPTSFFAISSAGNQ